MLKLILPIPPSANRYWRIARGRLIVSDEAKAFRRMAFVTAKQAGLAGPSESDEITIAIVVHPPVRKNGSKRLPGDLDNRLKVVIDALQGIAYVNDNQVVELSAKRGEPVEGGHLVVTWQGAEA